MDYHDTVFKNQPAVEGVGFTDEQLRSTFTQKAGIEGDSLTKFQKCYDTRATQKLVQDIADKAGRNNVNKSPTFVVNGKPMDLQALANARGESAVLEVFKKAAAGN